MFLGLFVYLNRTLRVNSFLDFVSFYYFGVNSVLSFYYLSTRSVLSERALQAPGWKVVRRERRSNNRYSFHFVFQQLKTIN